MWGGIFEVQDPLSLINFAPVSLRVLPTPKRRNLGAGGFPDVYDVERNLVFSCAISGGRYILKATFLPLIYAIPEMTETTRPRPFKCENTGAPDDPKVTSQLKISTSLWRSVI